METPTLPESAGNCGQSPESADILRTENAYGEPWKPLQPDLIYDSCSYWMADALNREVRNRIISCVNACAGMADPAAEIQAMREAIREVFNSFADEPASDSAWLLDDRQTTALAKLQPFIKP